MNRKVLFFLFLISFNLCAFSEEDGGNAPQEKAEIQRFDFGARFSFGGSLDMGAGFEFGFLIANANRWDIRNYILLNGYEIADEKKSDNYTISVSDRLDFGRTNDSGIARSYGFLEGGVGVFSNDSKDMWKTPLAYSAGFGGGVDFFMDRGAAWFFEVGVLFQFLGDERFIAQKFGTGFRYYL